MFNFKMIITLKLLKNNSSIKLSTVFSLTSNGLKTQDVSEKITNAKMEAPREKEAAPEKTGGEGMTDGVEGRLRTKEVLRVTVETRTLRHLFQFVHGMKCTF